MAKIDEVLTKLGIIDVKVSATKEIVEDLKKENKEQWVFINNNKNRVVKLETKSEVEEKKIGYKFYILVAIIGWVSAVMGSLIMKSIK